MTVDEMIFALFLIFTAGGVLILNAPRKEPYWPKVTKAYINAIFTEDPEAKAKHWAEFHEAMRP